jgi:transposase-like protein
MTVTKNPEVEVFERARPGKRRRYTAAQKRAMLDEAALPGQSISLVSRRYGVAASLLFRWKQIETAGGAVALAAFEVSDDANRQVLPGDDLNDGVTQPIESSPREALHVGRQSRRQIFVDALR